MRAEIHTRDRGLSVRAKLALTYAGFAVAAGCVVLGLLVVLLVRYLPEGALQRVGDGGFAPSRTDVLRAVLPLSAWCLLLLVVVGLAGGWMVAGRVMRPLDRIGAAVRRASQGQLDHRVSLPGRRDELRDLADDVDVMLARLEVAFDEQRRFAANASHELRTPLATMKTMLQVARMEPGHDESLLRRLEETNERSIATTQALLVLADLDRRSAPADEECDVAALLDHALATESRDGVRVEASCTRETTTVAAPADLVALILGNLVRNANVHNLERGGTIWVAVGVTERHVEVRIENSGTHVQREEIAQLMAPLSRGRTKGAGSGSGLGLAIVRSAADLVNGRVALAPRAGGGLVACVSFPRSGSDDTPSRQGVG